MELVGINCVIYRKKKPEKKYCFLNFLHSTLFPYKNLKLFVSNVKLNTGFFSMKLWLLIHK